MPKGKTNLTSVFQALKGGRGSGNFGHSGIPGKHGGSAPKGGLSETVVGNIRIKGGTPEQIEAVKDLINSLPAWHTSLVNDRVVDDLLQQYRHLPNYERLAEEARKVLQTGNMVIEFQDVTEAKRNPLTGEEVESVGGHVPNYISLRSSLTGDELKGILAHEIGHQVSYLGAKLTTGRDLRFGRNYKPAGENLEGAWKRDRSDHEHTLGIQGSNSERYQRWQKGFQLANATTSRSYSPATNMEERFGQAFRMVATGRGEELTPSVRRYVQKFFNKKPPSGSVGVD
ncbi:hypothetical protein C4588_03970 [Candidatus Parcubacteria bacterium]|nr:MAG: hypothetical protein C4588_03970 [Candidatus Parcubacteria bacterium]